MPQDRDPGREAARATAHAGIERLIDTLVPALIAKLATLSVGELEVREGDWHVRLRRPAGGGPELGRRAMDRAGQRTHTGHDGVGAPGPARSGAASGAPTGAASSGNGTAPGLAPVGPGRPGTIVPGESSPGESAPGASDGMPVVRGPIATSPAVGIFQPGKAALGGTRVRAGDKLGAVDMLGIPQDVVAPTDGIVIGVLVEGGTAVEYGQELVHIEAATVTEAR
ncbi:MAG: hypothetical protein V4515_06765 [Chloroflexota bacterium]